MKIKIKKFAANAVVPQYAKHGDAGADLCSIEPVILPAGERTLVKTGIGVEIPLGYVGLVHPRSGLATKGVSIVNAPGTIDSGYRGEIMVNLINLSNNTVVLNRGDRIAQLVIQAVEQAVFELTDELSESERGIGGHGSTGM